MGGVYHSPSGEWNSTAIRSHILADENPQVFLTINDLELTAYIAHLNLFAPRMAPLEHKATGVEKKAADSWARRGSVSTATAISPLLREAAWITRQAKIHASINHISGVEDIKVDAASILTHLPVHAFLQSFNPFFP